MAPKRVECIGRTDRIRKRVPSNRPPPRISKVKERSSNVSRNTDDFFPSLVGDFDDEWIDELPDGQHKYVDEHQYADDDHQLEVLDYLDTHNHTYTCRITVITCAHIHTCRIIWTRIHTFRQRRTFTSTDLARPAASGMPKGYISQANSASYPPWNGKWVPTRERWWSAAESKGRMAHSIRG